MGQLDKVPIRVEDAVNIEDALTSGNPMKALVGFTALKNWLADKVEQDTGQTRAQTMIGRQFSAGEMLQGKAQAITKALL